MAWQLAISMEMAISTFFQPRVTSSTFGSINVTGNYRDTIEWACYVDVIG